MKKLILIFLFAFIASFADAQQWLMPYNIGAQKGIEIKGSGTSLNYNNFGNANFHSNLNFVSEYDTIYTGIGWWEESPTLNSFPSVMMTVHGSTWGNLNSNDHNHLSIYTTNSTDTVRVNRWSMQFAQDTATLVARALAYQLVEGASITVDDSMYIAMVDGAKIGINTTTPRYGIELQSTKDEIVSILSHLNQNARPSYVSIKGGLIGMVNDANTSNKYIPGIRFASDDADFTTVADGKVGAGVVGYATETYDADTKGGMGVEIFGTPNNPGAAEAPEVVATFTPDRTTIHDVLNLNPITGPTATALTPSNGDIIYVSSTDGVFVSIGIWAYIAGTWTALH